MTTNVSFSRRLEARGHEIYEIGGSKNRKPILCRPDMDGHLMAERIALAVNLTSSLSIDELRKAQLEVISATDFTPLGIPLWIP